MEEIITAISTVGFPIVAYGGMFWYMVQLTKEHREEMDTVKASLDANTEALIELKALVHQFIGIGGAADDTEI